MIFNMVGGGGGSGATLVVSSPANVSVTVSKDDKSYTKNSGSLGSATFKGLATGTWTVTISGNGQTATKTIEITADYAITIAFFSASINITYPANSNCVVTNSGGQTVASDTNTGSSIKTWTATVGATGTYTVTATATDGSGKTKSTTVSITADGQSESVMLAYEMVLYNAGAEFTDITGGWNANGYTTSSRVARAGTKYGTYMYFPALSDNNSLYVLGTNNTIQFGKFSKLIISVESSSGVSNDCVITPTKTNFTSNAISYKALVNGENELDISSLDSGFIALYTSTKNSPFKVTKVRAV